MSTETNPSRPNDFSGTVPMHYDEFLGPMFFEPYAVEICRRINPSSVHVALELASGTGRVTHHLRKALPSTAKLIASDISRDMLSVAKEKLKTKAVEWQEIDAQALPFANNSIDLVVCSFGYMFVPDKIKAFQEAHRVLRAGGMLLITSWDKLEENHASHVYRSIAKKYLPDPLPASYRLPFSMSDEGEIKELLQQAGFSKISIEKVGKTSVSRTAKEAAVGLTQGGVIYNDLMSRNPAWVEEIKESVEKELTQKFGAAPMKAPMQALITQAWK